MNKYIFLLIGFFISINSYAQNQNVNWFFGNKAGVSFATGNPISLSSSQMVSIEGCASVSNPKTGALLFYSNGIQVWDANGNIMPNGTGLLSGSSTSATQGVLILPFPGTSNLYYIFTVDETSNNGLNGFRYSLVDMNLNNSLGDIIPSQKNKLIQTNTSERMAVTYKGDGTGYWIVIHERNNNRFKAYAIDKFGINLTPISSNIGSIHSTTVQINGDGTMGYMKFSPNGKKLAVALYSQNKVELLDFDACTGVISNPKTLATIDNPYGVEFSPDNNKLYFGVYDNQSFNGYIYQADIQNLSSNPTVIGLSSSINNQSIGALQLAPDNKIYVSINSESWLSAINSPNNIGAACDFVDKSVLLPNIGQFPTTGILGLPSIVLDEIGDSLNSSNSTIITDKICFGDTTNFSLTNINAINQISWNFGVEEIQNDTSSLPTPSFTYPNSGTFIVTAIIKGICRTDTIEKTVSIVNCDTLNTFCKIFAPSVFSPNNDNLNDRFKCVSNCQPKKFQLLIYNRWGECVFESRNISASWDGTFKGSESPIGVYFYFATYSFSDTDSQSIKGDITLVK